MSMLLPVTMDIGPAVHQSAGLSRYSSQLSAAIHEHCRDRVALQLFYNQHSGHQPPANLRHIPVQTLSLGQYAWRLSVLAGQISRLPYQPLLRRLGPSRLYHATEHLLPRLKIPTAMTVHDLIFERFPQHHKITNRAFLSVGMPLFVRAASQIIAVSRHTAQDLHALYNVPPSKISVIYEGVESEFRPACPQQVDAIRSRYSPDRPYFLMLGTLEPRKNHRLALQALAQIKAQGYLHRLVVGGGKGWLFEPIMAMVATYGLENDVVFTGYVPGEELPALYSGAEALLLPSQYEGFGLPLLEAMACGAPVISSNVSSLPELAGDAALLIDAEDVRGLVNAMRLLIDQPAVADLLRQRGLAQAAKFSWKAAAEQTVDCYYEVAAQQP